ncbi:Gamma-glutamyl-hercynylcysteine sulfoxide hydrolase [Candidatus Norongarragalina meridionalis]|nr:Gamma-glutamyl-hercynylcysteine sulfoxide hydrolase [Candidatus Norongarragalina meridionalis]
MCRLLAQVSLKPDSASRWFFDAPTPFKSFEKEHGDGWGVGWHADGKARVEKQGRSDCATYDFSAVRKARSNIVLSHFRKATSGVHSSKNAHPFVENNFLFAHNGTIAWNDAVKKSDSRVYFDKVLARFADCGDVSEAVCETVKEARPFCKSAMNFVLSDGERLYAFCDWVAVAKSKPADFYRMHFLVREDEHVALCSEPLSSEKWEPMERGELLIVGKNLEAERLRI